ncbi:NYN domain-containing protein [Rugamonas sp. DEMB1]|uniref:NYN domain-containing protein n=1 Tax=Rugamonas sp. DEMB1 TaxID=3039386 RepID=UPI00244C746A|nr:NYN domain-containing protein [Rugamonas sp. DEMB1]WGG49631.1 NYN domain-containing protein [Rugamonas sp. DEMB1]
MPDSKKSSGKTAVYIDGYNLYYGRLRGTEFKWLDLVQLFQSLLAQRDQSESLEKVIFFTAPALATFATHGESSVNAQAAYHRALEAVYGEQVEIVRGKHAYDRNGALLPAYIEGQPYDRNNRIRVWKLEEKKTDVNLAIRMYRDACKERYDRVVLVSNDSDAEPVLSALREDFPNLMIGIVSPVRPPVLGADIHRRTSQSLAKYAHWTVTHLTDDQLSAAQLPDKVKTNKKPILRPAHWVEVVG